ncbi:PrpF domain-containing protein [Caballeronia sp. LP003]|uniref:2-methylaconitate cis-trans isomerase PrpF family protein n=1 Tax=Caballeronia sp. LP003 TaxID=3038551 RepID=UPI00285F83CD|nr:PrpF domain-containing protein [Caballeronia sp. LP003]MDR5785494.1 PrpF domain-containing protein [Caballeronia sp. LP003]
MNATETGDQLEVRCVLMRGGTSKALFFHESALPPAGAERDRFLKRAMGTPDVMQIDGMGGSRLVTSKVAIIRPSTRGDADVDYTFAQVDVDRDQIDYDANCGNISSAVGPFAIDEKLVAVREPLTTVRIYNTNTDKLLVSRIQVRNGRSRVLGDCAIPGVPGAGAEILMDYAGTVGAKTGRLLPTGNAIDEIVMETGRTVRVSIVDVANPCVFIEASTLGLSGSELPDAISANGELIRMLAEIQAKAGERIGLNADWTEEPAPVLPLAAMVAAPADYEDVNGDVQPSDAMDLRARLVFMGKCHDSMSGTASMCIAAASRISGSLVHQAVGTRSSKQTLRIGHPLGVMEVKVVAHAGASAAEMTFDVLGLARTARRLMAGTVYVPVD